MVIFPVKTSIFADSVIRPNWPKLRPNWFGRFSPKLRPKLRFQSYTTFNISYPWSWLSLIWSSLINDTTWSNLICFNCLSLEIGLELIGSLFRFCFGWNNYRISNSRTSSIWKWTGPWSSTGWNNESMVCSSLEHLRICCYDSWRHHQWQNRKERHNFVGNSFHHCWLDVDWIRTKQRYAFCRKNRHMCFYVHSHVCTWSLHFWDFSSKYSVFLTRHASSFHVFGIDVGLGTRIFVVSYFLKSIMVIYIYIVVFILVLGDLLPLDVSLLVLFFT